MVAQSDLISISDRDWRTAKNRLAVLQPLLDRPSTRADYEAAAQKAGYNTATLYRWAAQYRKTGELTSLLPTQRPGGAGKSRLNEEVELLIQDVIQNFYLTDQQASPASTVTEIHRRCIIAGLPKPAVGTVMLRINRITERERLHRRRGIKAVRENFDYHQGSIPDAGWPLAMVEMDHTLLPVIIVDEVHRKSIRRAWITLAIDVYSRVCLGMYLTLDAPSAMSAGLCIAHALLPKQQWLSQLGMPDVQWPFGMMEVLHMDNASEFRGQMIERACDAYDIDVHWRPAGQPQFGAHIERLMGTVSEGLKTVKGATFSGPKEKGEYDAEGNACMTLAELERWLVLLFAAYHGSFHSGIKTTPLAKWREGQSRGVPVRSLDADRVHVDFMPFEERTVQQYGILWDVHYWHDALRPWIGVMDPKNKRLKRKFIFRRDPRDISRIYFFDPELKRYIEIPYRDTSLPPASIWEWRSAQAALKAAGMAEVNEREVFGYLTQQRELESDASHKTKSARREAQRREHHAKVRKERPAVQPIGGVSTAMAARVDIPGYNRDEATAYEDDY